jgi:hypothetical protein
MISKISPTMLKFICKALMFLASLSAPAQKIYATVDTYTLGSARYIAFILLAIVAYYFCLLVWICMKLLLGLVLQLYAYLQVSFGGAPAAATAAGAGAGSAADAAAKVAGASASATVGTNGEFDF